MCAAYVGMCEIHAFAQKRCVADYRRVADKKRLGMTIQALIVGVASSKIKFNPAGKAQYRNSGMRNLIYGSFNWVLSMIDVAEFHFYRFCHEKITDDVTHTASLVVRYLSMNE